MRGQAKKEIRLYKRYKRFFRSQDYIFYFIVMDAPENEKNKTPMVKTDLVAIMRDILERKPDEKIVVFLYSVKLLDAMFCIFANQAH